MFAAWGRFVHRHRAPVLLLSIVLLVGSGVVLGRGGTLLSYQLPGGTESAEAEALLEARLPGTADATVLLVFSHPALPWTDPAFKRDVQAAAQALREDARVASVRTPYDVPGVESVSLVAESGRRVVAVVSFHDDVVTARDYFPEVRERVRVTTVEALATGPVAVYSDINVILAKDLARSEVVSFPLTLLLLLLAFGSVVAALLPLGVGGLAVMGGLAGVFLASRAMDVSVYAVNIVTLIGLGVAIDYSLFVVSRFREEMARGGDAGDALAVTMATAGRATTFSGVTVAIGLLGLTFFQGLFFSTMGLAGAIVVGFAVLYALTFLPALLAYLGPRVDRLRIPLPRPAQAGPGLWSRLAHGVMRRPLAVLAPTLAILLLAGAPFLHLQMGGATASQLPETAESRRGLEALDDDFPDLAGNVMLVVVQFPGDPLARERVGALHDFSRALAALDGVGGVASLVDLDPAMTKRDYQDLYAQPRDRLPGPVADVVRQTVGEDVVLLRVRTPHEENAAEARALVERVRAMPPPGDGRVLVTGPTALDVDALGLVAKHAPGAVLFVVLTTYVLLLLQTGSVILPLKAVVMNFLSIAASFGAMVWIFQDGNLSGLLGFTPAPLDPSLPVLLFCIVFGLSMDYEVLLLSRMHEEWERTGDNAQAVAMGLEKSGKLITSAAAIMVVVFGAFALAQVTLVKALGLGLALAVALDATVVRALVVPALMRIMGDLNWWAPAPVRRLRRFFG